MSSPSSARCHRWGWSGLLVVAWLAAGACGPAARPPVPDPVPVRLGVGLEALSALAFIAEDQGFFAREGLTVLVQRYPSGRLALRGLLTNEVEVACAAQTPVVVATPKHPDLRILAIVGSSDNEMQLVGRRDRGINSAADLRGKKIAAQPGSSMHFFTQLYLLRHGLQTNDVALLFRPPHALPQLLVDGTVDAIASREPLVFQVQDQLGTDAVILADRGLYVKLYLLIAPAPFLRTRPAVAPRLLRALKHAEGLVRQQPAAARAILARALNIPAANLARLWPNLDLRVRLSQALLPRLEDEARWARECGLTGTNEAPNYFQQVELRPLESVDPEAVSIIH